MQDQLALAEHLSRLRPDWENSIRIMEPFPGELPVVYHISKNTEILEFVPQVSARTATKEDKSIPRICTAYTLWGCIKGYAAVVFEFGHIDDKTFKGGYQIYGIPYTLCVRPNKRLLPDVDATEERWIVGYDDKHLQIKPVKLGKFFVRTIATTRVGAVKHFDLTLYLEIEPGFGEFRIHPNLKLKPGYWEITVTGMHNEWHWPESGEQVKVTELSKSTYHRIKNSVASTLSFEGAPSAVW